VLLGAEPEDAVTAFRAARGCGPETDMQVAFVALAVDRPSRLGG
jgi:hypothetical protein